MPFKFEDLKVWQKAIELSGKVNKLIKTFPDEEKYVLATQMQRATDSIALNIAEGSTGQTTKEFNRFLGMALRSAIEVVSCLFLGKERDLIDQDNFNQFYGELEVLIKMIQSLRNSLK